MVAIHCGRKLCEINALNNGPIARLLAHSLAPLTYLLAPHCSLCSRASLRSLTRSRAHGKEVYVFEVNASISYSFNPLYEEFILKSYERDSKHQWITQWVEMI